MVVGNLKRKNEGVAETEKLTSKIIERKNAANMIIALNVLCSKYTELSKCTLLILQYQVNKFCNAQGCRYTVSAFGMTSDIQSGLI